MIKTWLYFFLVWWWWGGTIIRGEIGVWRPWRLHQRGGASEGDDLHLSLGVQTWGGLCQYHRCSWLWWPQEHPESPWSCFQPPGAGTGCWCCCAPEMRRCWWASSPPQGQLLSATPCLAPGAPALSIS